jgi:MFS family permease
MSSPTFVGLRGQALVYAVTLCSGLGFLLFGYDLAFMGGVTTSADFLATFNNPGPALLGFLVSSYEVGAMLGALGIFLFGDNFGRKTNVLTGACIICVGATIQTSSFSIAQFLVGRIVAGFGLGKSGYHMSRPSKILTSNRHDDHDHTRMADRMCAAKVKRSNGGHAALEPHPGSHHRQLA